MSIFSNVVSRPIHRAFTNLRPAGLIIVFLAPVVVLALYWLSPLLSTDDASTITRFGKEIARLRENTLDRARNSGDHESTWITVNLNPLLAAEIKCNADVPKTTSGMPLPARETGIFVYKRIRYDNLILFSGIAVILMLVTWIFTRPRASVPDAGSSVSLGIPAPLSESAPGGEHRVVTAEAFLSDQVQTAAAIANALYDRSTLLISGGIVMAFIGVGVFYATVPETADIKSLSEYLPRVVRPTGILVFVEAIAWFLLRQYRVQIEDYKSFYRIYLRRANLLIALKTIASAGKDRAQLALAAAFLQDDQSGRLRKGETTETLATLAQPTQIPCSICSRTWSRKLGLQSDVTRKLREKLHEFHIEV